MACFLLKLGWQNLMSCGFQYVKDACHKTVILPSPGASRIPGPRQRISGVTQNFSLFRQAQHKSWAILPIEASGLVAYLPYLASAVHGLLLSECSLFCGLRMVLYAGSHLSGYYTPIYCAA